MGIVTAPRPIHVPRTTSTTSLFGLFFVYFLGLFLLPTALQYEGLQRERTSPASSPEPDEGKNLAASCGHGLGDTPAWRAFEGSVAARDASLEKPTCRDDSPITVVHGLPKVASQGIYLLPDLLCAGNSSRNGVSTADAPSALAEHYVLGGYRIVAAWWWMATAFTLPACEAQREGQGEGQGWQGQRWQGQNCDADPAWYTECQAGPGSAPCQCAAAAAFCAFPDHTDYYFIHGGGWTEFRGTAATRCAPWFTTFQPRTVADRSGPPAWGAGGPRHTTAVQGLAPRCCIADCGRKGAAAGPCGTKELHTVLALVRGSSLGRDWRPSQRRRSNGRTSWPTPLAALGGCREERWPATTWTRTTWTKIPRQGQWM